MTGWPLTTASVVRLPWVEATTSVFPLDDGTGDLLRGSRITSSLPSMVAFTGFLLRRIWLAGRGGDSGPACRRSADPESSGLLGTMLTGSTYLTGSLTSACARSTRPG